MSNKKINELLLLDTMSKAQIPGVSIAYRHPDGKITPEEHGLADGCGLVAVQTDPSECSFNELGLGSKNAIVLFENELYYVNQRAESVQKIQLTENNQIAYQALQSICTNNYKLAEPKDYEFITALVGLAPPAEVQADTVFGAASLSKPVFAYLVQRLIYTNSTNQAEPGTGKFNLAQFNLKEFDLDTPLYLILPLQEFKLGNMTFDLSEKSTLANAQALTARMVLSHTTGLAHGELKFQFKPNPEETDARRRKHGYSNVGILYLQQVIEKLTGAKLEPLAKKHVFDHCQMPNSSYQFNGVEPCAAYSLGTTAKDYANFVDYLINDPSIENPFVPQAYMTEDNGSAGKISVAKGEIDDTTLERVAWGLGWGLQTDENGAITAYHSGDMNDYRAWVAVNISAKNAVVFFANSHNGHILAEQIIPPTIQTEHAADYFFQKWGFARNLAELGSKTNNWGLNSLPPGELEKKLPIENSTQVTRPVEEKDISDLESQSTKSLNL